MLLFCWKPFQGLEDQIPIVENVWVKAFEKAMYIGNIFPTSILNKVFSDCCEQSTLDANATKGLHTH